jgi:4-amino-4-deoxy-L-arabinose transferase-like glycosyltransferase
MLGADPSGSSRRRTDVVLSILRGEKSAEEAAAQQGVDVAEIREWEKRFVAGGQRALSDNTPWRLQDWPFWLALLSIAFLWLVLRTVYWNGYYIEDAPLYVTDATYLAVGNYHARSYVNGLNVGTYGPVAVALALFGKSEIALSLWPMFCSFLGLVSLATAAAILFGRRFALLAALLYATHPGDVFFSTVVMPDAVQAGWLAFSMFLVVCAYAGPSSRRQWMVAAAGMAMGFCHLIRANGAILLPIGVVGVVLLARQWKRDSLNSVTRAALIFLAGWSIVLAVEGLAYFWAVGDFFHRMHVVNAHYGTLESIAAQGLNTNQSTIPSSIFPPLLWWRYGGWGTINQEQAYHGLIFCFALGALVAGALAFAFAKASAPEPIVSGFILGAFWFAWPLLYHQFGSQSLTHFVPIHRLSRHLVLYAPGAMFLTVAACALLAEVASSSRVRLLRSHLATATAVAMLAVHLAFNWYGARIASHTYQEVRATYERIRDHLPADVRTIIGDPSDLGFFDFWLNPLGVERVRIMAFANYSHCDQIAGGVVLTRSNSGWIGLAAPSIREAVTRLPCLLQPPAGWRLLYEGSAEKIFVIEPRATR